MGLRISDEDIFILHSYGPIDNAITFIRMDHQGGINYTKNRSVASEFVRGEVQGMIDSAKEKRIKLWSIRVV